MKRKYDIYRSILNKERIGMLARTDKSLFGQWWWTIDRWVFTVLIILMALGGVLNMATSPLMADRFNLHSFYFAQRHLMVLVPSFFGLVGVSLLTPPYLRHLAVLVFCSSILLLILVPFIGVEIKGARRWINLAGFSLQPSEFIKPSFAVVVAWLFTDKVTLFSLSGVSLAFFAYAVVMGLLLVQPDLGMSFMVSVIFFAQFFMMGLNLRWIIFGGVAGMGGLGVAYFLFPHVASRIDRFLNPASGDCYQVNRSLQAFMNGGLGGKGPGEGIVKKSLPDAHADFIFAVIGEEFGCLVCLALIFLFAFVVLRSFMRIFRETNLFIILSVTGLLTQFGFQALVNMASALHLIPTKGMTLPFISYGGSSMLALALGMGMVLGLTRRRVQGGRVSL